MLRRNGIRPGRVMAVLAWFVLTAAGAALVGSVATPKAALAQAAATGEPVPFGLALAEPSGLALRASVGRTAEAKIEPASTFRDVRVEVTPEGVLATLEADGKIGVMKVFTMSEPSRLVVDLPGLESEIAESQWEIGSPFVERVRMKAHPNKVRVVFDAGEREDHFVSRRLIPFQGGLMVAIGTGEPLSAALAKALDGGDGAESGSRGAEIVSTTSATTGRKPASQLDSVAAADSVSGQSPLQVYGVNFDSQADRDRIVVLTNGLVDYEVHQPDPETVVFSLLGAVISPEAEGRLVARSGSPISMVTAFQQPDVPVDEVRIVVERTPGMEPVVTPQGPLLFIDFAPQEAAADPGLAPVAHSAGEVPAREESTPVAAPPAASQIDSGFGGTGFEEPEDVASDAAELDEEWARDAEQPVLASPSGVRPPAVPGGGIGILEDDGLIAGKVYRGRQISLDFNDVPVADVMRLIAEVSDLNVIAGDEVQGNVTIRMMDVPWDQALDVILMTKGLGFVQVGNVLRIAPVGVLKAEEELLLQERRNRERLEDLIVKLQPVNYANVGEAATMVQSLLSDRGSVIQDERTSTLIIKDIPSVVSEAVALVRAIDTQTPQVLIEAKIVEANLDFSRELGTTWSIGSQPLTDGFNPNSGPRTDLGGRDFRFHDANNITFSNPISAVPTASGALTAFLLDEKINLDVQIQAQESTGEGKVISSPRIVTLDNRKAEIQQGVSIPFQTFEQGDAKLEFVDAVLSLTVTPHITADKSIIMDLEVTRNAPDTSVATPTGSPAISKNVARTHTLVRDGQTLVLGGIYTVTKSESHSRVPYLSRIPILGGLFKNKRVKDDRKELLIFVTPRIIVPPGTS